MWSCLEPLQETLHLAALSLMVKGNIWEDTIPVPLEALNWIGHVDRVFISLETLLTGYIYEVIVPTYLHLCQDIDNSLIFFLPWKQRSEEGKLLFISVALIWCHTDRVFSIISLSTTSLPSRLVHLLFLILSVLALTLTLILLILILILVLILIPLP